jgi:hypothetical protein
MLQVLRAAPAARVDGGRHLSGALVAPHPVLYNLRGVLSPYSWQTVHVESCVVHTLNGLCLSKRTHQGQHLCESRELMIMVLHCSLAGGSRLCNLPGGQRRQSGAVPHDFHSALLTLAAHARQQILGLAVLPAVGPSEHFRPKPDNLRQVFGAPLAAALLAMDGILGLVSPQPYNHAATFALHTVCRPA